MGSEDHGVEGYFRVTVTHPHASMCPWVIGVSVRSFTLGRKRALYTTRNAVAFALCTTLAASHVTVSAQPSAPDEQGQVSNANTSAGSSETSVAELIAALSESDSRVATLELEMGKLREAVNKALVDLRDAQARAEQARQGVSSARKELDKTQAQIEKAQEKLNEISRAAYRNGASSPGIAGVSGNGSSEDALARRTYLRISAEKQREAIDKLDRLRTQQANKESKLRQARNHAEAQEAEAIDAQESAQRAIDENAAQLSAQQREHQSLVSQRDKAQSELDSVRGPAASSGSEREAYDSARAQHKTKEREAQRATAAVQEAKKAQEKAEKAADEAAKRVKRENQPSTSQTTSQEAANQEAQRQAQAQRDAEAAAKLAEEARKKAEQEAENERKAQKARDAALAASSAAAAALVAVSQPEHATLDDPYLNLLSSAAEAFANAERSTGGEAGTATQQPIAAVQNPEGSAQEPEQEGSGLNLDLVTLDTNESVTEEVSKAVANVSSNQKVEAAIARAMSQVGVPYVWGGGNANGPTRGLNDGGLAAAHGDHKKVGFDCSGLVLYAFAGAGISLAHYTGYQYNAGKHVSPSEMQRGDLIFYGPGGSQHVAIYLGNGQMIEAPNSGSVVSVVPVRYSGMSEYVVRLV